MSALAARGFRSLCGFGCALIFACLGVAAGCNDSELGALAARRGVEAAHAAPGADAWPWGQYHGQYPIRVTCTTGMVAELARAIGGSYVTVTTLMGAGVDPHLYKASPGDVRKLTSCDVVFYSGLHLEGKMGDLLARLGRKKPSLAVAEAVPRDARLWTPEGTVDPHVWFDVSLWRGAGDAVRDALIAFDPPHAEQYREQARRYSAELAALDDEARGRLAVVPRARRILVTAHDAFRYFGRAYDVEVRAIQGISTESEAGVREINELVDFLVSRRIPAVFVESSVSDRNMRALVEGCGAQGHRLSVGGELFSDALGADGTPEGTYVGMVRHNVETIAAALERD